MRRINHQGYTNGPNATMVDGEVARQRCGSVTLGREGMKDSKESHVRPAVKCPPSCSPPALPAAPRGSSTAAAARDGGPSELQRRDPPPQTCRGGPCTRPLVQPLQTAGSPLPGAGRCRAMPLVTSAETYRQTAGKPQVLRHIVPQLLKLTQNPW